MAHHTRMSTEETIEAIRTRIAKAIPDGDIQVGGGGGHFTISVTSAQFEGLNTLKKKRMVYTAITDLMSGDDAPVHAVDRLDTFTPSQKSGQNQSKGVMRLFGK